MKHKLTHIVSVYGSLLQGRGNHSVIGSYIPEGKAKYLGESTTEAIFSMEDLGSYPGLMKDGNNKIFTEVYALDDEAFASVRMLEGYNPNGTGLYTEMLIETEFGTSTIYIYNYGSYGDEPIKPDENNIVNWNTHYLAKQKDYRSVYG